MNRNRANTATIWVCVDCLFVDVNGETTLPTPDPEYPHAARPEPWSLAAQSQGVDVTLGLLSEEHADGCVNGNPDTAGSEDCDCAVQTFSRSSCDGCGCGLAGERHAYTLWLPDETPAEV